MGDNQTGFNAGIVGLGVYLPEKRAAEQDFINAGVPKEYIDMWGVYEHRVSEPDETPSDMSIKAAKDLIRNTGIDPKEIDLIIDSALVPDYILPGNSHKIQYSIGASNAVAFDITPSNGGVIPQLVIAQSLILSQIYKKILITCSCKFTSVQDKSDWASLVVGGDGAAAALIARVEANEGILSSDGITKGEFFSNSGIKNRAPLGSNFRGMICENDNKKMLFFLDNLDITPDKEKNLKGGANEFYLKAIPTSSKTALQKLGLSYENVDFWITHQNTRLFKEQLLEMMGINAKNNYYYTYEKYGNMFNANLLVNLKEAVEKSYIRCNDIVVLGGVIAGLSAGSVVMRWGR